MALHNKDAVLLGLGGPMGSDIVFFVHDDYCYDHGNGLLFFPSFSPSVYRLSLKI